MENHYEQICKSQEISNVNISYFSLDTWYVLKRGSDIGGCGRTPDSACSTLPYLLQQVNRTHLPPPMATHVSPSKEIDPVNRTQVPPSVDIDPDNRTHLPPASMATQVPPSMDINPDNGTQAPPSMDIDPDNGTHLPPSKALDIVTDKDLNIDQQIAVSTLFFIITSNYHQT